MTSHAPVAGSLTTLGPWASVGSAAAWLSLTANGWASIGAPDASSRRARMRGLPSCASSDTHVTRY